MPKIDNKTGKPRSRNKGKVGHFKNKKRHGNNNTKRTKSPKLYGKYNRNKRKHQKWKKRAQDKDMTELLQIFNSSSKKSGKKRHNFRNNDTENNNHNNANNKTQNNTRSNPTISSLLNYTKNNKNSNNNAGTETDTTANRKQRSKRKDLPHDNNQDSAAAKDAPQQLTKEELLSQRVPKFITNKHKLRTHQRTLNEKQLKSLPKNILIPKCVLCNQKMLIERGDMCYDGFVSVMCDICGRDDIHGEVWHCPKGADDAQKHSGFNLCKTCGYLIPRGRQNEIRRVSAPSIDDDLGLINNGPVRNRRRMEDGCLIYKFEEVQKNIEDWQRRQNQTLSI